MEKYHSYTKSFILLILFYTFFVTQVLSQTTDPTIKEIRNKVSTTQDFSKVNLGISEKYPNTRIVFYVDINNDK